MNILEIISDCSPHNIHVCGVGDEFKPSDLPRSFLKEIFDGSSQRTVLDFFNSYCEQLKFPGYFGRNWNAFNDCITDLEWLEFTGIVLFTTDADFLFEGETDRVEQLEALTSILSDAADFWTNEVRDGEEWDRDKVPFHCIFQFADPEKAAQFLSLRR